VDLPDLGKAYVLGLLTAVDENQHAGISFAEVAGAFELQHLAAMESHLGALGTGLFGGGEHDRSNQAEEDGVVDALGWGVKRLRSFALVKVVDQPARQAAAVASGHVASERVPRREVAVGGTTSAGAEVDALEGAPRNQHPAVAPVIHVDPQAVRADVAPVGQDDSFPVEQRHQRAVARLARDRADGVETQSELTVGGVAAEFVGAGAIHPIPLDEAGEVARVRAYGTVQPIGGSAWAAVGQEVDGADPPLVEIHDAVAAVPHPDAIGEVVGSEEVEVEHGPALESHLQVPALRLDARDVAEARHERPGEVDLVFLLEDFDPEDLNRAALPQLLERRVGAPGILFLGAVEIVAPERLLVASKAHPPLVDGAVIGGHAAEDEALVRRRRRLRDREDGRGRNHRGGFLLVLEGVLKNAARDEGKEDDEHNGERATGDPGFSYRCVALTSHGWQVLYLVKGSVARRVHNGLTPTQTREPRWSSARAADHPHQ